VKYQLQTNTYELRTPTRSVPTLRAFSARCPEAGSVTQATPLREECTCRIATQNLARFTVANGIQDLSFLMLGRVNPNFASITQRITDASVLLQRAADERAEAVLARPAGSILLHVFASSTTRAAVNSQDASMAACNVLDF